MCYNHKILELEKKPRDRLLTHISFTDVETKEQIG